MRAAVEYSPDTPLQRCFLAWSLAAAGETREATEMPSDFMHLRKMNCLPATSIALIDAALGDTKAAWKWLDLARGSSIPGDLASQRIRDSNVFGPCPIPASAAHDRSAQVTDYAPKFDTLGSLTAPPRSADAADLFHPERTAQESVPGSFHAHH